MKERIFTDENGNQLIVLHRKSAVIFSRETDLSIEGYVSPYWKDQTPVVHPDEMEQKYMFSPEAFKDLILYLEQIGQESWTSFTPKEADSMGADYAEYYDKEFDTEGSLWVKENGLWIDGPFQDKTINPIVRLYKFNKPKFQSFVYDLKKKVNPSEGKNMESVKKAV